MKMNQKHHASHRQQFRENPEKAGHRGVVTDNHEGDRWSPWADDKLGGGMSGGTFQRVRSREDGRGYKDECLRKQQHRGVGAGRAAPDEEADSWGQPKGWTGERRGMAKRRQNEEGKEHESHLRSVAQQYSQKPVATSNERSEDGSWAAMPLTSSRNGLQVHELNSERQQLSHVSGGNKFGSKLEQHQSLQAAQVNYSKVASRRAYAQDFQNPKENAPEKSKASAQEDQQLKLQKRIISEEELIAMEENQKDNRAKQPKRSKLTLAKQSSKNNNHQQKQQSNNIFQKNARGLHSAENQRREIVSQYLNVPIDADNVSKEEIYPRATMKKYKPGKSNQGTSNGKQATVNVPLMRDFKQSESSSYLVSHKPSQIVVKNSNQHIKGVGLQNKLQNNIQLQQQNIQNLDRNDLQTFHKKGQNKGPNATNMSSQNNNDNARVVSARTRSQSNFNANQLQKAQQEQLPSLFQTTGNKQSVEVVAGQESFQQRDLDQNNNSVINNMRSADQMREPISYGGGHTEGNYQASQDPRNADLLDRADSKTNDTQSNGKFASGLLGFIDNIKKNYFNNNPKAEEKQLNDEEESSQLQGTNPRSGSLQTNESPNAGMEISQAININEANNYQIKFKRQGVGMSPRREESERNAPYLEDRRAQKNYGDLNVMTLSQPTLENNKDSALLRPSNAPFNDNRFDRLENFENDLLRLQENQDLSPDIDNSLITESKSDIRRIQRKSQQETIGLHVLQTSQQVRSQHTYLGSKSNLQIAMTTKNQNQRSMFTVQSQAQSNKKENLRKMSHMQSAEQQASQEANDQFKQLQQVQFTEYADDVDTHMRQGAQEEEGRREREIEFRKVKDTADLQMLKNQKKRSDINMRLSKQIEKNNSEYQSPQKNARHILERNKSTFSNQELKVRSGINLNPSDDQQQLLGTAGRGAGRQVSLFGKVKVLDRNRSAERFKRSRERSIRLQSSKSPPHNQEDFDQLYNLQDGESSDTNLQYNQNHKILHQDGLPIKKTVTNVGLLVNHLDQISQKNPIEFPNPFGLLNNNNNLETKTPIQNTRISNYVPQNQLSNNNYINQSSVSLDQQQKLQRRDDTQQSTEQQQMYGEDNQQNSNNYNNQLSRQQVPSHHNQHFDKAFQSDLTQKYEENLHQFLQYQSKDGGPGASEGPDNQRKRIKDYQENGAGQGNNIRMTGHFNAAETEQDLSDRQNYNSAKPTEDKIVMKNRGHTLKNNNGNQQQEGTFLEFYGKNHIKSELIQNNLNNINDPNSDFENGEGQYNRPRSPNGTDDNLWLFEGMQQNMNRQDRDNYNPRTNQSSMQNAQSFQGQSQNFVRHPVTTTNQHPQSFKGDFSDDNNQKIVKAAKYTMKSKSPRNTQKNNLHLLLRGKSQNRVNSKDKEQRQQSNQASGKNSESGGKYFPQNKTRDKSNPPSTRHRQQTFYNPKGGEEVLASNGLEIQDTLFNPANSGQRPRGGNQGYQPRRGLAASSKLNNKESMSQNQSSQQNNKLDPMVQTMYTFFKNIFQQDNRDTSLNRNNRQSAETKASSGQSAMLLQRKDKSYKGYSPQEALEIFGNELTEFEKIEVGNYSRVYTIGCIRRENQYSIADKDGFYNTRVGEHLGYRYLIKKIIDKGSFGQVVCCIDCADPNERVVAAKIGKNKKFDVDNANIEIKFLTQLNNIDQSEGADNEGHDRIVQFKDSFNFRQHVIIIFEHLHMNLYKYISLNKKRKPIFDKVLLKRVSYQIIQGLKYMKNKQVIHCDMKPENIIFTDQKCQNIKIIDFGASCKDWNSGFFYVQSRYYRAPEIVLGLPYDHAADIWSLGCIIYELITGRPIFPAKDENELLEFFTITIGNLPEPMIVNGKNFKKFYKKTTSIFGSTSYDLIRSKKTIIGNKLKERSEPVRQLLKNFDVEEDIVDFIEKCLVYDLECRITPHDALYHQWFYVQQPPKPQAQSQSQVQQNPQN